MLQKCQCYNSNSYVSEIQSLAQRFYGSLDSQEVVYRPMLRTESDFESSGKQRQAGTRNFTNPENTETEAPHTHTCS